MATRVSNEAESSQGVVMTLALSRIQVNEAENLRRVNQKDIPKLAKSIAEVGLLQPVIVKPLSEPVNGFEYRLDAGYRRMAAIRSLDWDEVPAMVVAESADSLKVNMTENGQREDVNYIDLANGIKRRLEAGAKIAEIAADLGKTVSYLHQLLPLVDPEKMRPALQKAAAEGKYTFKVLRLLPGMTPEEQDQFLAEVDAAEARGEGSTDVAAAASKKRKAKRGETRGRKAKKKGKGGDEGGGGISAKKALLQIEETEGELLALSRAEDVTVEQKAAFKDAIWTLRVFGKFLSGALGAQALGKKLTNKMAEE